VIKHTPRVPLVSNRLTLSTITKPLIQPKLKIGTLNDKYEQEADLLADQVMRMPGPVLSLSSLFPTNNGNSGDGLIQRTCSSCAKEYQAAEQKDRTVVSNNFCPNCRVQRKALGDSIAPVVQRRESEAEEEEALQTKGTRQTPEVTPDIESGIQSLKSAGQLLSDSSRGYFEPRYGHDFSQVRIYSDSRAADLANKINAKAFTLGKDVVFGMGQYQPRSGEGRRLIAHELTHVLQQNTTSYPATNYTRARISGGANISHIQRSPLSDSVRNTHVADSSLEALLARLAQNDIQAAQTDTDVDAELIRILAGHPDDLWVAQQIRQGQLSETSFGINPHNSSSGPPPVRAHFFPGSTARRALVVAGVHGNEVQGVEVANKLIADLQTGLSATPPQLPLFSVIVVPSLFPANVAAGRRQRSTQTNRNLPDPSQTLATAPRNAAGRPLAAPATSATNTSGTPQARPILDENIILMALMERFRPERIISIHGTRRPGAGGVFADPRRLNSIDEIIVRGCAALLGILREGNGLPANVRHAICEQTAIANVQQNDHDLALRAASAIDASTSTISGRTGLEGQEEGREFGRAGESGALSRAQQTARESHPSVAGNVGTSGNLDTTHWSGVSPAGVSLGDYASARGMSIFTVEPPLNCTSADYGPNRTCSGRAPAVSQAERSIELMSYAEAIRTVLLG
jgi:hypothetical protein